MSGVVQNQDSYMKGKIAQRKWYDRVLPTLKARHGRIHAADRPQYDVVMPYRLEDADYAIVGSGCMIETAEAAVDYIRENMGVKVGLLHITCWRPFPSIEIVEALRHCKAISVIERLDIPMMQSNPLLCEIKAAFADAVSGTPGYPELDRMPRFFGGSAGLGSRDVRAGDFIAITDNMLSNSPRTYFTLGIKHETALPITNDPDVRTPVRSRCAAIRSAVTVRSRRTKSSRPSPAKCSAWTCRRIRNTDRKRRACRRLTTSRSQKITSGFTPNSSTSNSFLSTTSTHSTSKIRWPAFPITEWFLSRARRRIPAEIWAAVPAWARRSLIQKNARVFALDTVKIAKEVSSLADLQQRMQGIVLLGVFLRVTPFTCRKRHQR